MNHLSPKRLHASRLFILGAVFAATLTACGGGGSDAGTGSTSTATSATTASDGTSTASTATASTTTTAATTATTTTAATTTATTAAGNVTAWVRIAADGDPIKLSGTTTVRYGDGVNWITKDLADGSSCNVATFGSDPSPWVFKACEIQVTTTAVVQTGLKPVVNPGLMPTATVPYTTDRVRALTAAELAQTVFQPTTTDIGSFREPCTFSHMAADDPIVFPGQPGASHMHTFMGNSDAGAASTADSIAGSGGSTCYGGTLNRTAYWQPTIIDIRTGQPIPPSGANFYYKLGYLGVVAGTVQPFPKGLRIIAGDASATAATNSLARFACLSSGTWQSAIPTCAVGDVLMASVTFPQCWDGVNLDSPDHKSHMAYGTGTGCPTDHPVPLAEISIRFDYKVTEADNGSNWRLSSDNYSGPGGYSMHADWFNGWDTATDTAFVNNCVNGNLDCHDMLLGDGRILY